MTSLGSVAMGQQEERTDQVMRNRNQRLKWNEGVRLEGFSKPWAKQKIEKSYHFWLGIGNRRGFIMYKQKRFESEIRMGTYSTIRAAFV